MSFEFILVAVRGKFSRTAIVSAFGPHGTPTEQGLSLWYDKQNSSDVYLGPTGTDELGTFMVDRPCGDPRLFESLFRILRDHVAIMTYPDSDAEFIVANTESAAAFAEDNPELAPKIRIASYPDQVWG